MQAARAQPAQGINYSRRSDESPASFAAAVRHCHVRRPEITRSPLVTDPRPRAGRYPDEYFRRRGGGAPLLRRSRGTAPSRINHGGAAPVPPMRGLIARAPRSGGFFSRADEMFSVGRSGLRWGSVD